MWLIKSGIVNFDISVERFIPLKIVTIRPKDKPWMTGEIRLAIRKRDCYLRKYNNNKLSVAWERYRKQRNQIVSLIRCAKKAYFDKVNHDLSDPKISTKKWWSISKRLCGGNEVTSIPAIVEDRVTVTDPIEMAEIFNAYFVDQTKHPGADTIPPSISSFQMVRTISTVTTTNEEVFDLMKNVDTSKACGHDGIGNQRIKLCSHGFSSDFTSFVNVSLCLSQPVPSQWKLVNIIPLFKNDNRQLKVNYRPVSPAKPF